jgi:hypothetical protein
MWEAHDVEVDFVGHKHHLAAVVEKFECERLIHIGDTSVDEHYALLAGLEFVWVDKLPSAGDEGWIF